MWSLNAVLSLQWGLQVPLPQQKLTSLQCTPSPGPAVSLRRRSPVGERHGDVNPVGQRLGTHRLEGFPQDPERGRVAARDAVSCLQGRTLVPSRRSCGKAAGRKVTRSERDRCWEDELLSDFATLLASSVSLNLGCAFFSKHLSKCTAQDDFLGGNNIRDSVCWGCL